MADAGSGGGGLGETRAERLNRRRGRWGTRRDANRMVLEWVLNGMRGELFVELTELIRAGPQQQWVDDGGRVFLFRPGASLG